METAADMLNAVFTFADMALDEAPAPGQMRRITSPLMSLLTSAPRGDVGANTGGFWFGSFDEKSTISYEELVVVQPQVKLLLNAVAERRPIRLEEGIKLHVLPSVVNKSGAVLLSAQGSFADRFMLAVLLLLRSVGASHIRPCAVCRRAFIKVGRRRQCGRKECERAYNAAYFRKWKASATGQKALKRKYDANGWTLGARAAVTTRPVPSTRNTNQAALSGERRIPSTSRRRRS